MIVFLCNLISRKTQHYQTITAQSSVQEHLEKQVLGIYTNAKFSAEPTVLQ